MKRLTTLLALTLVLFTLLWQPAHAQESSCSPNSGLCYPRLKRDTNGATVADSATIKKLQQLLRARGYTTVADGKFGYGTETVVRKFQKARRLKQDGIVGWQTWEALFPTLSKGSRGATVRLLQTWLNAYGQGVPKVSVDGVYGAATQRAVTKLRGDVAASSGNGKTDAIVWCYLVGGNFEE